VVKQAAHLALHAEQENLFDFAVTDISELGTFPNPDLHDRQSNSPVPTQLEQGATHGKTDLGSRGLT